MPLPSVKVIGRVGIATADTNTDLDDEPDLAYCDEGTIVLTPIITETLYSEDTGPGSAIGHGPTTFTINGSGQMTLNNQVGGKVIDYSSTRFNPHAGEGFATHRAEFKGLKRQGVPVSIAPKNVRLAADTVNPEHGACVLTELLPITVGTGVAITRGVPGPPGDPTLTDEVTAGNIATGGLTRAALEEAISELGIDIGPLDLDDVQGLAAALAGKADAAATTSALAGKASTGHSHTSTQITDFTEAVQDAIAALLQGASGVTLSYNDAANTLTITGGGAAGLDAEAVRDAIGVALVGTGPIQIVVNDAADTITFQLNGLIPIANAPAGTILFRDETATPGTYPVRGTSRTDIKVFWTGTQAPTKGGGFMADNDIWLKSATA